MMESSIVFYFLNKWCNFSLSTTALGFNALNRTYVLWRAHASSQHKWWDCQSHLLLSLLLSVDLISPVPEADIFLFLSGVLTLSQTLVWGTVIYCLGSSVCRVNMVGWLGKGTICCSLSHTHPNVYTHIQSHDSPRWLAEMFTMLQSLCPAEPTATDKDKQDMDINNHDNYNLPEVSNCYNWIENVKLWVWWHDKANTHEGHRNFPLTWQALVKWKRGEKTSRVNSSRVALELYRGKLPSQVRLVCAWQDDILLLLWLSNYILPYKILFTRTWEVKLQLYFVNVLPIKSLKL